MATVYAASEGTKFAGDAQLTTVQCATCHMTYAIPNSLHRSAKRWRGDRSDGWRLFCPLGHEWWYVGKTEEERLREEAERQRSRAGRLAAERDQATASARAYKGHATRARRSAAKGECACCGKTYVHLARHMKAKHPDFDPDAI